MNKNKTADTIDFTDPNIKLPSNMRVHAKYIRKGRYEVNGVILEAEDLIDAERKYLRKTKQI